MPDDLLKDLLQAETAVWDALVKGDSQADADALSDDFLGVYPDGFSGKAAHVEQVSDGATVTRFDLSEVQARALGPDHGLLCYRADYLRPGRTETEAMYVSSIWERTETGWINIFSQDTPADPTIDLP